MSDTLRPINSYDYPTDAEFQDLREVGQELIKEQKLEDKILEQEKAKAEDQGFIADNPLDALSDVASIVPGAAIDAAESIGQFLDLSGDTLNTAAANLFGHHQFESDNPFSDKYEKGNWIDIPDQFTPETKSGLGKLARGLGEFGILAVLTAKTGGALGGALGGAKATAAGTKMAGLVNKMKAGSRPMQFLLSPKAAKFGKIASEGAVADFIMNDSEEGNIANLVDQYAPIIPFSKALAVNEEDNPYSARIKSVIAGAGMNIVGHALVGFLKGKFAATKKAKELIEEQKLLEGNNPKLLTGSTDAVGKGFVIKDFYSDVINRSNNEGTQVMYDYIRKQGYADAAEARAQANANFADGKGFRNEADYLDLYLRKYLNEEDFEEAQRLFAGEDLKSSVTIKGDPEEGFPDQVISPEQRVVDTRGRGTYYHGAASEIDKLVGPYDSDAYFGKDGPGLFGFGFYTTDDLITANKYKKKNVTKAELSEPIVYKTRELQEVKFYDLDAPMSDTVLKEIDDIIERDNYVSDSLADALADVSRGGSLADFLQEAKEYARYNDIYSEEFAENVFLPIQRILEKEGIGGYTHKGGIYRAKGKRTHQVRIYWDPANQLELGKTSTETATLQDYIDLAMRKGQAAGDPWMPEMGMSRRQERANRLRKPDPEVNPNKFSNEEKATQRVSTDTDNPYTQYVEEATKMNDIGQRPVGSTNMSTNARTRQMAGDDQGLRKLAEEVMDSISENDFKQIDNAQPFAKRIDMYYQMAKEINEIIAVGGDDSINALRRYLNADLGTKKVDVSDLTGRKNFIFWDFDGEKIITITPQMANALKIAVMHNLKKASDIGTGVTMLPKGANATRQALDILDNLQLAMVEMKKISFMTGNALQVQKGIGLFEQGSRKKLAKKLKQIELEEKTFTERLKELIQKGDKKQARQLAEIYAITDGRVTSLSMIQNYLKKRLGFGGEINGQRIPSQVFRELASVYYNSILSSPKTPMRAVVGTNLIAVLRPFQMWAGATLRQDRAQAAVAAAAIDGIGKAYADTFRIFKYNWDQGVHNKRLSYQGRFDLPRDLAKFQQLGKYAEEFGTPAEKMMYRAINQIVKLNTNPWMRYSQNIMGAGDAAARTAIGRFTARIRAAQEGVEKGIPLENLTDYAKAQEQRFLDKIFTQSDGNMMVVTDEAALMAGREATMTKDIEGWMKVFESISGNPLGMFFFPFARTGYNALRLTTQHTPLEIFSKRYKDIMAGTNLEKYGLTAADLPAEKALMEGRIAMGSAILGMAIAGAAAGNIYGDAPRDKEMRDLWAMEGIRPYTMRVGNTLVSYRDFEPFNTIIATGANLFNYQHALDEDLFSEFAETAIFMMSAALVDKSMLAGVEDLATVLDPQGLERKGGRLFAQTARSILPWSGLLGSIGDLLDANQKEAVGMFEIMVRRDAIFKSTLPPKYDILSKDRSGTPFQIPGSQPLARAFNFLSPIAITNTSGDPVKTTLYDIGYNLPDVLRTYKGIQLTSAERSLMTKYLSMGNLRSELEKVFASKAFQNGYKEFKDLKGRRRMGIRVEDQEFYQMVQKVFRKAKKDAYYKMIAENPELDDKLKEAARLKRLGGSGNYEQINKLLNIPK